MALLLVRWPLRCRKKTGLPLTLALLAGWLSRRRRTISRRMVFYIAALDEHRQAEWSGVRNTFSRGVLAATAGGVAAGHDEKTQGAAGA